MDFAKKKVLILGGAGLVGQSICKHLVKEDISDLVICSLLENEAVEFANQLKKEDTEGNIKYHAEWGNVFVRNSLKDTRPGDLLKSAESRELMMNDLIEPLNREILTQSTIFKLLDKYRPDIIIDSINTATGVAYQNIYGSAKALKDRLGALEEGAPVTNDMKAAVEQVLCSLYVPQLIRHVQIFLQSMVETKTKFYLKIGTCGTGGMGLNIPYTHSEDKPSQMLLSKSAVAGGHSILLFLMARTPNGPIIKELKPAAAIAWKRVSCGTIRRGGKDILLEDVNLSAAVSLQGMLSKRSPNPTKYIEEDGKPKPLVAPYIDTGENGLFSLGEFEALTDEGQMEFITPEEIAQCAIWEIKGLNTGNDIVAALDNSTMGPTYRAGYMRQGAVSELRKLIKETGIDSVAFEHLGPPRLSKLLYEAHLLKLGYNTFENVIAATPEHISKTLEDMILKDSELRSRILSITIPVLLSSGGKLLRGQDMAIPSVVDPNASFEITPERVEKWAHDGWVDLRTTNMAKWQTRFKTIMATVNAIDPDDSSSLNAKGRHYWKDEEEHYGIYPAKLVSWIFINEDKGIRMKG